MINIYSIKEVVEASNNILNRPKNRNKVTSEQSLIVKKVNNFINNNKPLLLTDEISEDKMIKQNHKKLIFNKKKLANNPTQSIKRDQSIEILYLKFDKKIKKNTLKVIYELQNDVSNLNKIKNFLQQSNKEIKKQLNNFNNEIKKLNSLNKNLKENETYLKNKIQILSEKLNLSHVEIKNLKKNKIELEKELSEHKSQNEISKQKIYNISEVENRNKFFQEENLRIGSELLDIKKKHDILKKEVAKYENQKSNLISKINSVNEALSDTNILTNIFENKVENKVNIKDHNKVERKINSDLDEQIKNIFSDKK